MRIGLLIPQLVNKGGSERLILYLARELQAMGEKVTLFANVVNPKTCYPNIISGLKVVTAGQNPLATRLPSRRLGDYFDMRLLADAITGNFDVLNPHHWPPHWAAVWAGKRVHRGSAIVWMCNDPPWGYGPGEQPENLRMNGFLKRALRTRFLQYDLTLVRQLDKTLVLSDFSRRFFENTYGTCAAVVRSGVDLPALNEGNSRSTSITVREAHGIRPETFLLLSVNILMPQRRVEDAVEAVKILLTRGYDVHLLAIGSLTYDPLCVNRLQTLVKNEGLQGHVTFTGSVQESELADYYRGCDIYLHPNEEQTWGLSVTEAMAFEKPVVVSTGAGVHEVLSDGDNALLVPPRRPDVIANAIQRLLSDEALRRQLALQGRKFVERNLSWRQYAESMLDQFEQTLKKKRGSYIRAEN